MFAKWRGFEIRFRGRLSKVKPLCVEVEKVYLCMAMLGNFDYDIVNIVVSRYMDRVFGSEMTTVPTIPLDSQIIFFLRNKMILGSRSRED